VLEPDESVVSPRIHLTMLYGDEDTCANELFIHLRKSLLPDRPWAEPHPVGYNYGGYINTNWLPATQAIIRKEIELAAMLGAEMFTVDAGWNVPPGKGYWEVFGDWQETSLLEGGLRDCFDYAREKGMGAALWLPVEIVGGSARVLAEHPEWMLKDGERQVRMLDLTQPKVEEHVYHTIAGIIERYQLACFRIDGGPELYATWDRPNGQYRESAVWRYYEALYRVFERVHRDHPQVALENCWGGGGRIDLGMMRRFHWVQYSDNWHAEEQLRFLSGLTLSMPPEQCLSFIGAINMNPVDADFCIRAGLFGQFCIAGAAPSPEKMNDEALAHWRHAVDLYKREIRPLLGSCKVFHHTPLQDYSRAGEWVVLEYARADAAGGVAGIFRLGESRSDTFAFVPRGLDIAKTYNVWLDNQGRSVPIAGLSLCTTGIPVHLPGKMTSELLVINEQG
jgi:alpha-galactosidase